MEAIHDRLKTRESPVVSATISAEGADYAVTQFLSRNGVDDAILFAPGNRFDATPVVMVRDGVPRVTYSVQIHSTSVRDLSQVVFFVDGATGEVIGQDQPAGEHQVLDYQYTLVPAYQVNGFSLLFNPAILSIWPAVCARTSGEGLDRFGVNQKFSTTVLPDPDYLLNGGLVSYYEHYTSSCQEQTPGGLQAAQVMTFLAIPPPPPAAWPAHPLYAYKDPNTGQSKSALYDAPVPANVFTDPVFDSVPAVEGQHTGELLVNYVRSLGYEYRQNHRKLDGAPIPVRIHSIMGAAPLPTTPALGDAWTSSSGDFAGTFEEANGYLSFTYGDGVTTRTVGFSEPSVMAHEFFHTAMFDAIYAGFPKTEFPMVDAHAIQEGLADCFAMAYAYDHQEDLAPGIIAPFYHPESGVLVDPDDAQKGEPNLESPYDSALYRNDAWWGASELHDIGANEDAHRASTLVSATCRSLVTGWRGQDPCTAQSQRADGTCILGDEGLPPPRDRSTGDVLHVYRTGALASYALGCTNPECPNEQLGMARLKDLLMALLTKRQLSNTMTIDGKDGLIEVMASEADSLASKWGPMAGSYGERVRVAFGIHGFGRRDEREPNNVENLISAISTGSQYLGGMVTNLVGAGWRNHTPIKGDSCCDQDDDFYVLTEQMAEGDQLSLAIVDQDSPTTTSGAFRMRVYFGRPCGFDDATPASLACNVAHQEWPTPNADGSNAENCALPVDPESGECADYFPGVGVKVTKSTPGTELVFVGVHGLAGPDHGKYALQAIVTPAQYATP